jgi:hypothetical protein
MMPISASAKHSSVLACKATIIAAGVEFQVLSRGCSQFERHFFKLVILSGGGWFCRRSRRTPIPSSAVVPSDEVAVTEQSRDLLLFPCLAKKPIEQFQSLGGARLSGVQWSRPIEDALQRLR